MKDLTCPICHEKLEISDVSPSVKCANCCSFFTKKRRTWDFRTALEDQAEDWDSLKFDLCYQKIGRFIDGYEHARRSGIPRFVEDYRLSQVKDKIAKLLVSQNHGHLLDVGCGNGWYALRLKEKWNFSGKITCVDASPFQINVLLDEIEKRNVNDISALSANGEMLPFADDYFDKVVITEVLEHVASPEKVIKEISRVIKPGGKLFMTTPSGPMCRFWKTLLWPAQQLKRLFVPRRTYPDDQVYDVPLSKSAITKLINKTDLKILEYSKSVFLPHESYLQFIPLPILRLMLILAKILEAAGPVAMFLGLHHIMIINKPWHSHPVIINHKSLLQKAQK